MPYRKSERRIDPEALRRALNDSPTVVPPDQPADDGSPAARERELLRLRRQRRGEGDGDEGEAGVQGDQP